MGEGYRDALPTLAGVEGGGDLGELVTLYLQRRAPFCLCPWLCGGSQLWGTLGVRGVHLDLGHPSQGQAKAGRTVCAQALDYTSLHVWLLSWD